VTDFEIPATGSAEVHVHTRCAGLDSDAMRMSGTVTLATDCVVIIPGRDALSRPGARA
jgi:hypothetical protein